MIYLLVFSVVILLSKLASDKYKNNKNRAGHFWGFLCIMILSIFAGLRAETVGTDVKVYIIPYIEWAHKFNTYSLFIQNSSIEPAFGTLLFITGRFFETPFFVLFLSQLLTIGPLYIVMYKNREKCSLTLSMIIYTLFFYNMSLCIMRQFISTAIFLLAALVVPQDNKWLKTVLIIISCLFHYSMIFLILFYYLVQFLQFKFNSKLFNLIIIGIVVIALCFSTEILKVLCIDLGIIRREYYNIFIQMKEMNVNDISIFEMTIRGILIIIPYILAINYSKDDNYKLMTYYTFFGFIMSFGATISQYLIRVSYSFNLLLLYTLPYAETFFKDKLLYKLIVSIICFIYWWVIYFMWNNFNTMPYMFY